MRRGTPLIIIGSIIMVFGLVFQFQGQSAIGPESSFMYANPEWITRGIQIAIAGIIVATAGIAISTIRKNVTV